MFVNIVEVESSMNSDGLNIVSFTFLTKAEDKLDFSEIG